MAFVAEDGTGLTDANSYVEVDYADEYHSDRGNTAWNVTNEVKEAALIKATDYIEQTYAGRWVGDALTDDQSLSWPRDSEGVPDKLAQAVCLLALEVIAGTALNPTQGRAVKREKVDVIEVEYMDHAKAGSTRPAIDGLLVGLIGGSVLNARVVRV